jgi:hypothetical protein
MGSAICGTYLATWEEQYVELILPRVSNLAMKMLPCDRTSFVLLMWPAPHSSQPFMMSWQLLLTASTCVGCAGCTLRSAPLAGGVRKGPSSAAPQIPLCATATAALLAPCATGTSAYHEQLFVVPSCAPPPRDVWGSRQQAAFAASKIGWIAMECVAALVSSASITGAPSPCSQEGHDEWLGKLH